MSRLKEMIKNDWIVLNVWNKIYRGAGINYCVPKNITIEQIISLLNDCNHFNSCNFKVEISKQSDTELYYDFDDCDDFFSVRLLDSDHTKYDNDEIDFSIPSSYGYSARTTFSSFDKNYREEPFNIQIKVYNENHTKSNRLITKLKSKTFKKKTIKY